MSTVGTALVAVGIAVGLAGVLVPLLPGTLLVWASIAVWAVLTATTAGWLALAAVTVVLLLALGVKYVLPARRMRRADVARSSLAAGAVAGIVGFFVVPVVGLIVGFVAGIYLAELGRRRDQRTAWAATGHAVKAVLLSAGIELAGGVIAAAIWVAAVLTG